MPRSLDCEHILENLEAYVDGDLDRRSTAAFAAHLEGCSDCAAEWHLATDVRRELSTLPSFDTPPAVLRDVYQRVGEERFRTPPRNQRPVWTAIAWPAAAAAALAATLVSGGLFLSRQSAPVPEPAVEVAAADPEAVARATEEARLAFAHVARVSRKAGFQVRDDLGEHLVAASARSLTQALFPAPEVDAAQESMDGETRPDRS